MLRFSLFTALLSILCFSCNEDKPVKKEDSAFKFDIPQIIDTLKNGEFKEFEEEGLYAPYYVGPFKRVITLDFPSNYFKYVSKGEKLFKYKGGKDFKIIVDTTQKCFFIKNGEMIQEELDNSKPYYQINKAFCGFPVFIINKGIDTLIIAAGIINKEKVYSIHIPLSLEAKDTNGKWKSIQVSAVYICGNGLSNVFLPPGEMVITAEPQYNGNYRTKMRLRFGSKRDSIFSNEFTGKINRTQFEEGIDSIGN